MTISFQQLVEGYRKASIGPFACDRIAVGDDIFRDIVEMIITATAQKHPVRDELIITDDMRALMQLALEGKQPVFFMGATVINGSMAKNEIYFLNSRRPDRDHLVVV